MDFLGSAYVGLLGGAYVRYVGGGTYVGLLGKAKGIIFVVPFY